MGQFYAVPNYLRKGEYSMDSDYKIYINKSFIKRNISDERFLVPVNSSGKEDNLFLSLNETASYIYDVIKKNNGISKKRLFSKLCKKFDEIEKKKIKKDLGIYLDQLEKKNIIRKKS
ncbi:MAG: PqqD family peptide modification chaperone [Candidatus Mcinerneyibacterium aminivorans]|uniref:PqqD family peptide modification chaperone n=1 Tax=Candidatus Mcinerneyibacterium aminivorans TaxID=2703815 RepID=A0A5D0M9B5_9BACT|nr:MAG: PqqD family peptide modification chaperone [Candidatus Mcinerneyibacterium aminivorans]